MITPALPPMALHIQPSDPKHQNRANNMTGIEQTYRGFGGLVCKIRSPFLPPTPGGQYYRRHSRLSGGGGFDSFQCEPVSL